MRKFLLLVLTFPVLILASPVMGQEPEPSRDTVCIQCHGGQTGRLGLPVQQWRESIHAQNGISCNDCHGGDPTDFAMAMSPDRGFLGAPSNDQIPGFCGRCHIGVKEDYLASAHGKALGAGGPQCVTCHHNHQVEKASLALINRQTCSQCHDYERAEKIRIALEATDNQIAALEKELGVLHRQGVDTDILGKELFSLRNEYHRLFHSVDIAKVRSESDRYQKSLGEMRAKVGKILDELAGRKVYGAIAVGLLIIAGFILLLMRKTYEEEE